MSLETPVRIWIAYEFHGTKVTQVTLFTDARSAHEHADARNELPWVDHCYVDSALTDTEQPLNLFPH